MSGGIDLRIQTGVRPDPNVLRLSIWSGPRNVSTALMYAFRSRADTIVFDEPLYGHYLSVHDVEHPGRRQVLDAMDTVGSRVIDRVLLGDAPPAGPGTLGYRATGRTGTIPAGTRIRMYKNMAHHLRGLPPAFIGTIEHALLTRDPRDMLPSLAEKIPEPTINDTGLGEQVALLQRLRYLGKEPVVLDARRLLDDPEGTLRKACERWGIAWDPAMLAWEAGRKPEDGVWAEHWYHNVHASTGFGPYPSTDEPFPEALEPLLERTRPFYEMLLEHAV